MRTKRSKKIGRTRTDERGAALLTVLLVATLLFAAGGALILSTATTGTNAIEATAERQAYYAAEAGLQMSLNALRGNMPHDNTVANGTTMNFRTAVTPDLSNGAGRSANNNPCVTEGPCKLLGWLPYNGGTTISVGNSTSFSTSVFDPDNSSQLRYHTDGQWTAPAIPGVVTISADGRTLTVGTLGNTTTIQYIPQPVTTVANATTPVTSGFGSFVTTTTGTGASVALGQLLAQFNFTIVQDLPWQSSGVITSQIMTPAASAGACLNYQITFDHPNIKADGAVYLITGLGSGNVLTLPCPSGTQNLNGSLTAPEPKHVVIRAVGYGPNFARRQLEMSVSRAGLDFEAPATLTIRGADSGTPSIYFDSGSSGAKDYTGHDQATSNPDPPRPAFAIMSSSIANTTITKPGTVDDPKIGIMDNANPPAPYVPVDLPSYLQTADNARAYLNNLQTIAMAQGRYYQPSSAMTYNQGTAANPVMTFIDGDCSLTGGAGFLVVTGNLDMSGNPDFDGVILVMGKGTVTRSGGGNGTYNGAMVVASFARTWPASENGQSHPFLAPSFITNGGGNSYFQYNSASVANALNALGARVTGVLEY